MSETAEGTPESRESAGLSRDKMARIKHRDAAYGPDLANPLQRDYHGQCVWDRRALLDAFEAAESREQALRKVIDHAAEMSQIRAQDAARIVVERDALQARIDEALAVVRGRMWLGTSSRIAEAALLAALTGEGAEQHG